MPGLRKCPLLELVATDVSDLRVLHGMKQFHLDCHKKSSVRKIIDNSLSQLVHSDATQLRLICGALSFDISLNKQHHDVDSRGDDTKITCDLSLLGHDGCLDFLKSDYDANEHFNLGYLCDLTKLGNLATKILTDFATGREKKPALIFGGNEDCLNVLATKGFPTESVFMVDFASDEDLAVANQVLKAMGFQEHSKEKTIPIVRYVCSSLISRLTLVLAVVISAAIDKLENCASQEHNQRSRESFVISEPASIKMHSQIELKTELAAHVREYVGYYIQDCVLNRLVSID